MDYLKTAQMNEIESRKAHAALAGKKLFTLCGTHYAYLRPDGTVYASGIGEYYNTCNQCGVSGWNDIVSVSSGYHHTVGLKADGTVVATDFAKDYLDDGVRIPNCYVDQCEVYDWKDIVMVSAGSSHTVAVKKDGTVVATGNDIDPRCEVGGWNNIVSVAAGSSHTIGLRKDGTVVATGENNKGECDVSDWNNIVDIAASADISIGIKADGSVVAAGYSVNDWRKDILSWKDIVYISTELTRTVGLRADGTVLVADKFKNGNEFDCIQWRDIVYVAQGCDSIIGIKKDGTVLNCICKLKPPYVDVSDVRMFNNVDTWEQEYQEARCQLKQKLQYRAAKVCQYCGGNFKGLFSKVCVNCGKKKDY
ncbi:MAG: RCC1 domain-containing protein [Acutalibacteraceae bacterium]